MSRHFLILTKTYSTGATHTLYCWLVDDWQAEVRRIDVEDAQAGLRGSWNIEAHRYLA